MQGGEIIGGNGGARSGMTLVEMLVVLAIVGISVGMITLMTVGRDDAVAQTEANRLADRLRLAADEALIAGRPALLTMNGTGYAFADGSNIRPEWGARHDLPRGVRLSAPMAELLIDPNGAAAPATMTIRDRKRVWAVTFDGLNATVAAAEPRP